MGEFFQKRTFTKLHFETREPDDTSMTHDYIVTDPHKASNSLHAINIDIQNDLARNLEMTTLEHETSYTVVKGSQLETNLQVFTSTEDLPDDIFRRTEKEDVVFTYDKVDPDWQYYSIHESIIRNESEEAGDPALEAFHVIEEEEELKQLRDEICEKIINIQSEEELNEYINELEKIRFSDDMKTMICEGGDYNYTILQYLDATHTLPRGGIASPYPGETKTFQSQKQLKQLINDREKWTYSSSLDANVVYNYPLTGTGRWRGFNKTVDKAIMNEIPHFCSFLDCDYFTTGTKRSIHEQNGKHAIFIFSAPLVCSPTVSTNLTKPTKRDFSPSF